MPECVLLIDDDPRLVTVLQIRLAACGYEVFSASCGEDGIAAAKRHRPQAILLDIHMPGMNGYEVCRFIRSDPDLAETPVVVVSAVGHESARRAALEAGANQFIAKPYQVAELIRTMRAAIENASNVTAP